jgi:hypothetical protein
MARVRLIRPRQFVSSDELGQAVRIYNSSTKEPKQHVRSLEIDCGISGDNHDKELNVGSQHIH